jgi:F-type H+-transporting ATPase subunit c
MNDEVGGLTVPKHEAVGKPIERRTEMFPIPLLAEITGSLHVALAAIGAALAVGLIGMKAVDAVGRNPGAATPVLVQAILSIAFAEAIVFYALFLVR